MQNTVLRQAFYPSWLSFAAQSFSSPCVCAERDLHTFVSPFPGLVTQQQFVWETKYYVVWDKGMGYSDTQHVLEMCFLTWLSTYVENSTGDS